MKKLPCLLAGVLSFLFMFFTVSCILPSLVSAHSSTQVVKISPNGFEPQDITVDENTTIIFVNQDSLPRWPASNLHPTHELYPEFDPKQAIKAGASWSFKPKRVGVWKYHDHLNPHIRGILTVTGESKVTNIASEKKPSFFTRAFISLANTLHSAFTSVTQLFSTGKKVLSRQDQTIEIETFKLLQPSEQYQLLTSYAQESGSEKAWQFLVKNFASEGGSNGNIHDLAHLVGKLIFEDKDLGGIAICNPIFAFGCYHGLLDTAFANSLDGLGKAETECTKLGAVGSGPHGSCVHGIGHGIASYYQSQDLKSSLASCDSLLNGQTFCHDGVLMEFARGAANTFYQESNPLYPCNELEKESGTRYSSACGRNQPSVLAEKFNLTFKQIATLCLKSSLSNQFKTACIDSLGFTLAHTEQTTSIINACNELKGSEYSAECLQAAAGELVFQNVPGWRQNAPLICNASRQVQNCKAYLDKLIKDYGKAWVN